MLRHDSANLYIQQQEGTPVWDQAMKTCGLIHNDIKSTTAKQDTYFHCQDFIGDLMTALY